MITHIFSPSFTTDHQMTMYKVQFSITWSYAPGILSLCIWRLNLLPAIEHWLEQLENQRKTPRKWRNRPCQHCCGFVLNVCYNIPGAIWHVGPTRGCWLSGLQSWTHYTLMNKLIKKCQINTYKQFMRTLWQKTLKFHRLWPIIVFSLHHKAKAHEFSSILVSAVFSF